ncbi:hypothetical protein [Rhizobium mayense]|uniref:EamA family transporter n=1 Tax=Rhizobium mayense TaxID=1312184 RepID=A0ABT7JQC2_9HYPH|nr:hypothetical protein [Rhizobium mayense]MDL2398544.1 hypothetical protein [Rhizobium mayense]
MDGIEQTGATSRTMDGNWMVVVIGAAAWSAYFSINYLRASVGRWDVATAVADGFYCASSF